MTETQTDTPQRKLTWDELIERSGGSMVRIPEQFVESFKAWHQKREKFQEAVMALGKEEHELNHTFDDLSYQLRNFFSERDQNNAIYSADIGMNMDAMLDGEYILNIKKQSPR